MTLPKKKEGLDGGIPITEGSITGWPRRYAARGALRLAPGPERGHAHGRIIPYYVKPTKRAT